jgi:hypothetical protein
MVVLLMLHGPLGVRILLVMLLESGILHWIAHQDLVSTAYTTVVNSPQP